VAQGVPRWYAPGRMPCCRTGKAFPGSNPGRTGGLTWAGPLGSGGPVPVYLQAFPGANWARTSVTGWGTNWAPFARGSLAAEGRRLGTIGLRMGGRCAWARWNWASISQGLWVFPGHFGPRQWPSRALGCPSPAWMGPGDSETGCVLPVCGASSSCCFDGEAWRNCWTAWAAVGIYQAEAEGRRHKGQ